MIYKIIVEPEVVQDLLNIKYHITKQDTPNKANQFISELKNNIKTLNEMPQRCRKSYYIDDENSHDLIYKKYTTVFKIIEQTVYVVSIFRQKNY